MARWKLIENEIKSLVLSVGGFELDEENLNLCIEFSLPYLKHHNFLDTDEKKVENSIKGIYDKLVVHNQQSKADLFKEYCQLFLEGPLTRENVKQHTSLHYSMLHLLLLLSHSPTEDRVHYGRIATSLVKPDPYQKFDWGAYLLEDELNDLGFGDDDDDDSNLDTSDIDIKTALDDTLKSSTNEKMGHIFPSANEKIGPILYGSSNLKDPIKSKDDFNIKDYFDIKDTIDDINEQSKEIVYLDKMVKCRDWLRDNVMSSYWTENVRANTTNHDSSRSSRLLSDWNNYLTSNSSIDLTKNQNMLTEYQVIREVLWLINGFEGLYVFPHDGFKYKVNKDAVVSHLAEGSLHHLLEEAAFYGTMVKCLKEFIEATSQKVLLPNSPIVGSITPTNDLNPSIKLDEGIKLLFTLSGVTQSHQAFSSVLSSQLKTIMMSIVQMERDVLKQEESTTLSKLMLKLEPQFKCLSILFYFLVEGVIKPLSSSSSPPPSSSSPPQTKTQILAIKFLESIAKGTPHKMSPYFITSFPAPSSSSSSSSSSPSSILTSQLLNTIYGCLMVIDQTAAFENYEVSLIVQVWMETCQPCLEMLDAWLKVGSFQDPYDEFFLKKDTHWENLGENFWEGAVEDQGNTTFIFLETVLKKIIVTGKSLRLLENIVGRRNVPDLSGDSRSLCHLYSSALFNELNGAGDGGISGGGDGGISGGVDGGIVGHGEESQAVVGDEFDCKDMSINKFLWASFPSSSVDEVFVDELKRRLKESDPLLLCSILKLIEPTSKVVDTESSSSSSSRPPIMSTIRSAFSLHLTLHKSLQNYIERRYSLTSSELLTVIGERCHLHRHLNAIKKYFFMESGRMMHDFCSTLFKSMESGVEWCEEGYLKFLMCESFSDESSEELDRITITLKDLKEPSTSIHCLESVVMDYKPGWPCNMIINSTCVSRCVEIFQFLLQIKWAKFSLDCLRFSDLKDSKTDEGLKHRMFIFKMRVLHFVNSFHNYIMTRILHSVSLEFQIKFAHLSDFDELISVHSRYLEVIHDRCLLHQKVFLIRKLILKVLQMAIDIGRMWRSSAICEKILDEMGVEYNRCIQFLSSLVNQVISRGSLTHCWYC